MDEQCRWEQGPIGVGVSGGSDSLALLVLTHDWAVRRGCSLIALTVDHGLRDGSRAEADDVARVCDGLGVSHQILSWKPPGASASAAEARLARHTLLANALRRLGGQYLLLGHTEDDQAETVAMRCQRGGGGLGQAGIRPVTVSPVWPDGRGIILIRPLLSARRGQLRDILQARDLTWIEDPTNADPAYERVRMRAALETAPERRRDILATQAIYADARRRQDAKLADWLLKHVKGSTDGLVRCHIGGLGDEDLAEGLSWLLMIASGTARRARHHSRLSLAQDILSRSDWSGRTLGGAWIAPRKGMISIARDPGGIEDRPAAGMEGGDI
ncbi:MAG: tRNA lysidine(34) synthetase TilS, partial [Pseudomonadota bacterium]